jgi:hypothetical protein
VTFLLKRFRGPLIAIVAVMFSATIAMAGQPASTGLANASNHAGKTVPVQATDEQTNEPDESESPETDESNASADNCTVDLTQSAEALAALTHGSVVCTAAHMDTPEGFDNHGAWVSSWAKKNHGADASATGLTHKPSH